MTQRKQRKMKRTVRKMRENDYIRLTDTVADGDVFNNGIFTYIRNSLTEAPEYLQDITVLNQDYYYRHSGNKNVSPLVEHFLGDDGKLNSDNSYAIARMIIHAYKDNWDKVYKALTIDYSPIENVDEYLTETTDRTGNTTTSNSNTHSGTDNRSKTGTETLTQSGTDATTKTGTEGIEGKFDQTTYHHSYTSDVENNPNGTSETVNGIAGFNSDEYSKDTKSTTTVKQKVTTIHRTLSIETDADGNPKKDANGDEIEREGKNSDRIENTHSDTTTYNTTEAENIDKTDTTSYNVSDDESINITDSGSGKEDTTGNEKHELRRHGNVGVTTNQYMINEELKLRKNIFVNEMFSDIDTYMTIPLY